MGADGKEVTLAMNGVGWNMQDAVAKAQGGGGQGIGNTLNRY